MSSPAIGIDLGTTNSAIAQVGVSGRPEIIPNSDGRPITPSVIYFGQDPPLVGDQAKEMQALGEEQVASFFKRSMGDPHFVLLLGGKERSPVELSALVLGRLKADAEAALGTAVTQAVITVPAYFHSGQREATIEAGRRAGLQVLRIINEPTAAALAYGLHRSDRTETVLVYDLGGGTFDVSLVRIAPQTLEVVATAGDHNLGGKDWDDRIATFLGQRFAELHGVDPLEETASFQDLLVRTEKAKKELSQRDMTRIPINHGGHKETLELTRGSFEELTRDLMERTERLCEQVLADAGLRWSDLGGVLLVGGSTRMPMVTEYVTRMSGKRPMTGVNVDEAVALGAAIQAALELEAMAPATAPRFFLAGRKTIKDVTAHSLGVIAESADRERFVNSKIIPKNTTLPAAGEREYQAVVGRDGLVECNVFVTEGESDRPREVAVRGKYQCKGAAPGQGGTAAQVVRYAYDKNGTIQVTATAKATGSPLTVTPQEVGDLAWLDESPQKMAAGGKVFDLSTLDLAVSPPGYDDIGAILQSLGLQFRPYEGGSINCNFLFLNCGSPAAPNPAELRRFVEAGGSVYASDLMSSLMTSAFHEFLSFALLPGWAGEHEAEILDPELQQALGSEVRVTFDMSMWSVLKSVSKGGRMLLRSRKSGFPLMVQFSCGRGVVFYTCFHNHAQVSATERKLLQLLVMKQISATACVPIEVVSQAVALPFRR